LVAVDPHGAGQAELAERAVEDRFLDAGKGGADLVVGGRHVCARTFDGSTSGGSRRLLTWLATPSPARSSPRPSPPSRRRSATRPGARSTCSPARIPKG